MPNRIIRDWTDSEDVNKLTVHAERFFTRLIMKVDDFGRYSANLKLLRSNLYPLITDSIRDADISRWMAECQMAGLIIIYEVSLRRYIQIQKFNQRLRQKVEKYPPPNDGTMLTNDSHVTARNEEETKKKQKPEEEPQQVVFPWDSEEFKKWWLIWIQYKKEQHKESYKSNLTQQAALKKLSELAAGREEVGIKIIEQSIASGWKGLFELKESKNGTSQTGRKEKFAEYFAEKGRESGNAN